MAGFLPPLPSLPQAPQVAPTQRPMEMGGMPGGTQMYPPNPVASVVDGINKFLTNYKAGVDAEKAKARDQFQQGLHAMQQGVPVDPNKLAKLAKRGGLDYLDFESSPAKAAAQPSPVDPSLAGVPGIGQAQQQAQQQFPAQAAVPPPQPGGFGKFMQAIGGQPPMTPNPNSSGMQWLGQQAALGKQTAGMQPQALQLQQQQMGNQQAAQALLAKALSGDRMAQLDATRYGLAKEMPGDEFEKTGMRIGLTLPQIAATQWKLMTGEDKVNKTILDLAEKLKDNFRTPEGGPDMAKAIQYSRDIFTSGSSTLVPGETYKDWFDHRLKVSDKAIDLMKAQPTLPANIANFAANALLFGKEETKKAVMDFISSTDSKGNPKFPTAGQMDWKKHTDTMAHEWAVVGEQRRENDQNYQLHSMEAMTKEQHEVMNDMFRLATGKEKFNSTEEQTAAYKSVADRAQRAGMNVTEADVPKWFSFIRGNAPEFRYPPVGSSGKANDLLNGVGAPAIGSDRNPVGPPQAGGAYGRTMENFWKHIGDILVQSPSAAGKMAGQVGLIPRSMQPEEEE